MKCLSLVSGFFLFIRTLKWRRLLCSLFFLSLFFLASGINSVSAQSPIPTCAPGQVPDGCIHTFPTSAPTWEPLYKTPTPRPTVDSQCPPQGVPINGWGSITPSASWLLNCGLCTAGQAPEHTEEPYQLIGACSDWNLENVCQDWPIGGVQYCLCDGSVPDPVIWGTPTPGGSITGTPEPGITQTVAPSEYYLGENMVGVCNAPGGGGCDSVVYNFDPNDYLWGREIVGYVLNSLECIGTWDACHNGEAGWFYGKEWSDRTMASEIDPVCYSYNRQDKTANQICNDLVGVNNRDGVNSSVWSLQELANRGVNNVEMIIHGGSYSWTDTASYRAEVQLIYYGVPPEVEPTPTPTPTLFPGYCGSVEPETQGNSIGDVGELPIIRVGPASCIVLGGGGLDLSWVQSLGELVGVAFPAALEIPGVQLCSRQISMGYLSFLGINIDMDILIFFTGGVAAMYLLWRS